MRSTRPSCRMIVCCTACARPPPKDSRMRAARRKRSRQSPATRPTGWSTVTSKPPTTRSERARPSKRTPNELKVGNTIGKLGNSWAPTKKSSKCRPFSPMRNRARSDAAVEANLMCWSLSHPLWRCMVRGGPRGRGPPKSGRRNAARGEVKRHVPRRFWGPWRRRGYRSRPFPMQRGPGANAGHERAQRQSSRRRPAAATVCRPQPALGRHL
jgi:hypothetical protein